MEFLNIYNLEFILICICLYHVLYISDICNEFGQTFYII